MSTKSTAKSKRRVPLLLKGAIAVIAVLVVVVVGFSVYASDYYHADDNAARAMAGSATVQVQDMGDGLTAFIPEGVTDDSVGLVFYPGGKVQAEAYAPLLEACAERGILCVLVEMPFNLAMFNMDAAGEIPELFPQVEHWYGAGHSLGGVMLSSYLEKHAESFEGMVFLASYTTANLAETGLRVLSIYGSNDGVLGMDSYLENLVNLPADTIETIIEGGNHGHFGSYGEQEGDGDATISAAEQIALTADAIWEFVRP